MARKPPRDHLRLVGDAIDGVREPPIDEPPGDGGAPPKAMPDGCPVVPLGTHDGHFYFLTALGELRALRARDVGNKDIVGMFAPSVQFLYDHWPTKKQIVERDEDGEPVTDAAGDPVRRWITTGWKTAEVTELLMDVCGLQGVWNARDKVRGRGAHCDEQGRLILHCGNDVLYGGAWIKPGIRDGIVYPTAPPIPKPGPAGALFEIIVDDGAREVSAGLALLHWLKSWNWARPTIDPMLALGFVAIARLGGAIDWRPLVWITGGAGEGKSTLLGFIADLFDGGLLKLESASEAAVRQLLGQDTLPVVLDETESEEDDRQMSAVLKLARIAASGGSVGKGGADHQGVQFTARSCFLFSSILIPALLPADKSRMAILELQRLGVGKREPAIVRPQHAAERRALAAAITRRMVDNWSRWGGTFGAFADALVEVGGHRGRGAKVFASLLAAAHIMLDDMEPSEEELATWGAELAVSKLAEMADADGDEKRILQYLGTCTVQLIGPGNVRSVAEWVLDAVCKTPRGVGLDVATEYDLKRSKAREALARIGVAIFEPKPRRLPGGGVDRARPIAGTVYLAIANSHQGLAKLFADSGWKSRGGASGVWSQSFKRIDGAVANERQRIGGLQMACTLVPIEAMFPPEPGDAQKETPAGAGVEAGASV